MSNDLISKKKRASWRLAFFLLGLLVAIDQISKGFAGDVYKNHDFAFSLRANVYLMYGVYLIVLTSIFFYLRRAWQGLAVLDKTSWLMILAGGLSNLIERLFLGYVRDFIYFGSGAFNFADLYIILGVALLLLGEIFKIKNKGVIQ